MQSHLDACEVLLPAAICPWLQIWRSPAEQTVCLAMVKAEASMRTTAVCTGGAWTCASLTVRTGCAPQDSKRLGPIHMWKIKP